MDNLKPCAYPEVHDSFFIFFTQYNPGKKILDAGAGTGSFTKRLWDAGYEVEACDFNDSAYKFTQAKFTKINLCEKLPYSDNTFDAITAIEVTEHLPNLCHFISECSRILKYNGTLFITTPNILSLKSRLNFLLKGYFYSFPPIKLRESSGSQHIMPLPLDQYRYLADIHGLKLVDIGLDKVQRTSHLLSFLLPIPKAKEKKE